jgi:hypothetical protein
MEDYFERKNFENYIKVRPFNLSNCLKISY